MENVVIVVHGGAYRVPDWLLNDVRTGIETATKVGYAVLSKGGSALDAVEAAVCQMEDTVCFNCGTGSVLTEAETIEMDAFIMDGSTQNVGAVANVSNIKNPVQLARAVMEKTNHCFLIGKGAIRLAENEGIEHATDEEMVTEEAKRRLKEFREFKKTITKSFDIRQDDHDTVGAVALDCNGNVAAATSTGGISGKMVGRIGDSPLSGSGGWAEANVGAISTTGHGEAILRVCLARRVAFNMEKGMSAQDAADEAVNHMKERVKGAGGLIAVSAQGGVGVSFSTERMTWGYIKNGQFHSGVLVGENIQKSV